MKLKMFSTKVSNFTQRNCSYINEWFLKESHLGSRGCGAKRQGVAQMKLSNAAVPVLFTDWQISKGNGMWVKWRFYDSLLLSNCENTTYPDFKNGFDCVVQNLGLSIGDFDKVLKIIAFLILLLENYLMAINNLQSI